MSCNCLKAIINGYKNAESIERKFLFFMLLKYSFSDYLKFKKEKNETLGDLGR